MILKCPECGGRLVADYSRGYYVCSNCGLVVERLLDTSEETNFQYLDEWREKERKVMGRPFSYKYVSSLDKEEDYRYGYREVKAVRAQLRFLLREKGVRELVPIVDVVEARNLFELFQALLEEGTHRYVDYKTLREVFEEACRRAGIKKLWDYAPSNVIDDSLAKKRIEARQRQIEEEWTRAEREYGGRVVRLARILARGFPELFQPLRPMLLSRAVSLFLRGGRSSDYRLRRYLKALERLRRGYTPYLVNRIGTEATAAVKGWRVVKRSWMRRYRGADPEGKNGTTAEELAVRYSNYGNYVRVARGVLKEPLSKKEWLRARFIHGILPRYRQSLEEILEARNMPPGSV